MMGFKFHPASASIIIKVDELVKSLKIPLSVIPAPYQVRGRLQPESRFSCERRNPVLKMAPGFRRDMPGLRFSPE
jgi:hypothetical protein